MNCFQYDDDLVYFIVKIEYRKIIYRIGNWIFLWNWFILVGFRYINGRSDDSLNTSDDINSSTIQTHTSLPTAVYYGDESDEGLVRIFPSDIKITKLFL